jgi:ADP-ribose pyrophosphatase YjhB (NUDIX family)
MPKKNWLSRKEYNFIYDRVPRACVDLVIKGKGRVVLSFRDMEPAKNTWHLPGGRVFLKETLKQAAIRIAKEEVGLKVKVYGLLGFMEFPKETQGGKIRHTVSLVFLVKPVGGKLKGGFQAARAEFFKKLPPKTYRIHSDFLKSKKIFK